MKISSDYPPNIDAIRALFGKENIKHAIFTYGDTIYNPHHGDITSDLMAHEQMHIRQQIKMGAEKWWTEYLANPQFRLQQEIEAYQAQYQKLKELNNRQQRRHTLKRLCQDLSGAMYGHIISNAEAKALITAEPDVIRLATQTS